MIMREIEKSGVSTVGAVSITSILLILLSRTGATAAET